MVKALAFVRPGDVLVVWKLDRLGRSLSHLLSIVNALKEKIRDSDFVVTVCTETYYQRVMGEKQPGKSG